MEDGQNQPYSVKSKRRENQKAYHLSVVPIENRKSTISRSLLAEFESVAAYPNISDTPWLNNSPKKSDAEPIYHFI